MKWVLPAATTTERNSITPSVGELIYDETLNAIFFGDGVTPGGVTFGNAPVDSVNTQTGVVVLDADDISDTSTTKKFNITHTGDATGASALTLATVNGNVGSFTNADLTVNAKGLVTAAANGTGGGGGLPVDDTTSVVQDPVDNTKQVGIDAGAVATSTTRRIIMPNNDVNLADVATNSSKTTNATHSGDATGATALTLATVNSNVGSFVNASVTVNAKGLVTAVSTGASGTPSASFDRITGLLTGGLVTVNGGDNTKFDVSAGTGVVYDWTTPGTPTVTEVSWSSLTLQTIPNFAVPFTGLSMDSTGSLVKSSGVVLTPQLRRSNILLSSAVHTDGATITSVTCNSGPAYETNQSIIDYIDKLGVVNTGNAYSANGANLKLDKGAGVSTLPFINYCNDPQNPSNVTQSAESPVPTITDSFRDGVGGFTFQPATGTNDINGDLYDDGSGTLATVSNNKWTIRRVYFFGANGATTVTFGQIQYNSLADAEDAIFSGVPVLSPLLNFGSFIAAVIVKKGATDLSDIAVAKIVAIAGGITTTSNAVSSVNGNTGIVVLGPPDIGAEAVKDFPTASGGLVVALAEKVISVTPSGNVTGWTFTFEASGVQDEREIHIFNDGSSTIDWSFVTDWAAGGSPPADITVGSETIVITRSLNNGTKVTGWVTQDGAVDSSIPFLDSNPLVKGSSDGTKTMSFEVDGLTTATNRTITMADQAIDLTPATGSFASAAQGTLAADALPKSGGAMTGNLTTNSLIDGRDVAADGVLATNALPKSGGAMTGNLTTNSLIDGRDVAADGVLATNALPKSGGAMTGNLTTNSLIDGRDVAADGVLATNALPKGGGTVTGFINLGADTGFTTTLTNASGVTMDPGQLVKLGRLDSSGDVVLADASVIATAIGMLVMASASITNTSSGDFVTYGPVTVANPTLVAGTEYYMSLTSGNITATAPSTTGEIVRSVGTALSTTVLFFDPDKSTTEV